MTAGFFTVTARRVRVTSPLGVREYTGNVQVTKTTNGELLVSNNDTSDDVAWFSPPWQAEFAAVASTIHE